MGGTITFLREREGIGQFPKENPAQQKRAKAFCYPDFIFDVKKNSCTSY